MALSVLKELLREED
jgi:hypothetical protein